MESLTREMKFIDNLGKYSDLGKGHRHQLLLGYREALVNYPSESPDDDAVLLNCVNRAIEKEAKVVHLGERNVRQATNVLRLKR